jgi:hypothetical protein
MLGSARLTATAPERDADIFQDFCTADRDSEAGKSDIATYLKSTRE